MLKSAAMAMFAPWEWAKFKLRPHVFNEPSVGTGVQVRPANSTRKLLVVPRLDNVNVDQIASRLKQVIWWMYWKASLAFYPDSHSATIMSSVSPGVKVSAYVTLFVLNLVSVTIMISAALDFPHWVIFTFYHFSALPAIQRHTFVQQFIHSVM